MSNKTTPLPLGTETRGHLITQAIDVLNRAHSTTVAQILSEAFSCKRFICAIDGSDNLFENWVFVDQVDDVFCKQISEDIFLFKQLYNADDHLYPLNFLQAEKHRIDISKEYINYIEETVNIWGFTTKPDDKSRQNIYKVYGDEANRQIALFLFSVQVPGYNYDF